MNFDLRKWLIKYRIPYLFVWIVVSLFLAALYYDAHTALLIQLIPTFVLTALCFPAFYLAGAWLVPRFVYKKQFLRFIVFAMLTVLFCSLLDYLITQSIYHFVAGISMFPSLQYFFLIFNVIVLVNFIALALGVALKISDNRFQMEKRLGQVEKEKISTELNFLRSQVNPHFLFNVMNTIYFQIDKENTVARGSVEKLSEMLRYQLYECTTDKIDIGKELEYIRNYITMQTLRLEKGTDVQLEIEEGLSGFFIAPLLVLPLIENAFKHISNFRNANENKIYVSLQHQNNVFIVFVSNTYDKSAPAKHLLNSGGMGMQNLKRRLDLLYPGKHEFDIGQKETLFEASLKIHYND